MTKSFYDFRLARIFFIADPLLVFKKVNEGLLWLRPSRCPKISEGLKEWPGRPCPLKNSTQPPYDCLGGPFLRFID